VASFRFPAATALLAAALACLPALAAAETEPTATARTLADWYALGGFIMHLLAGCSVLVCALTAERVWALRRAAVAPRPLLRALTKDLGDTERIAEACEARRSSLARVLAEARAHAGAPRREMADAIERASAVEGAVLREHLPLLGALAHIATMLGLLGTVLGMIAAFELISRTGTGDARVVAGGIFQALVTTAAGLGIGVFATSVHALLRRRLERLEIEVFEAAMRWIEGPTAEPRPHALEWARAEG
jgi:biopolymer transport protein ExbB